MDGKRILILGGTSEATALAGRLTERRDWRVTTSLAGRTRNPAPVPGDVRIGGFGGAEALADYLRMEAIDALVDATHPFAANISANAAIAGRLTGTATIHLVRPPWSAQPGDDWREVADVDAAAACLPKIPSSNNNTVFLTVGRRELAPFARMAGQRFLIRSIERPDELEDFTNAEWLFGRGPFSLKDERQLMGQHDVGCLVAKNAGGPATRAKLDAAGELKIPVVMISRPPPPDGVNLDTVERIEGWLRAQLD